MHGLNCQSNAQKHGHLSSDVAQHMSVDFQECKTIFQEKSNSIVKMIVLKLD